MSFDGLKPGCNPSCRACSHRLMSVEQSLAQKQGFVTKTLNHWANLIYPIISVEEEKRWGYRTSVTLSAQWDGQTWLFGTKSLDEVIPIPHCPVHHPLVNEVVEILAMSLPPFEQFPLAFLSISKKQCVLIVKCKPFENFKWLTPEVESRLKATGVDGFWIHFNPSSGRRLFEKGGWVQLFGNNKSVDSNGLIYGPTSFQQQISDLYHDSLTKAEAFLEPNSNTALVDLYCGTGTSLAHWEKLGAHCLGVETSAEALDCASVNAPKAKLLRGSCRLRVPQIDLWVAEQRQNGCSLKLYANPPRTGMEPEVLKWIVEKGRLKKIAYLSCSPGTLSKNLHFLNQNGYEVVQVQPYDFFPNTHHIECLALMIRVD